MRKALVVGIDYYENFAGLNGCVDDAHAVRAVLVRHADGSVNFDVRLLTGTGPNDRVTRAELKQAVEELFGGDEEVALFYFAGHGHIETTDGYLATTDAATGDAGLPLKDAMTFVNQSRVKNKIVVLDSCHSGHVGAPGITVDNREAYLQEGVTILAASTSDQYAAEDQDGGLFTGLFVDALNGSAANLEGRITAGSVYAHIDQSLGAWEQRPVFKTNVKEFVSLRDVTPAVPIHELRRLTEFFPSKGHELQLDPSYEPTEEPHDPDHEADFGVLQRFNNVNLLRPIGADHMYYAAMESKLCRLTALGEHYRRRIEKQRI